jgi:hypothetical protein
VTVDRKPRCDKMHLEVKAGDVVDMSTVDSLYRCFYGVHDTGEHRNANGDVWTDPKT